jgi:hypothetical protein
MKLKYERTKGAIRTMAETMPIPLDEREKLIVMAAYFRGMPPGGAVDGAVYANCGKVLAQALVWAGLWNDDLRPQFQGVDEGDPTIVDAWYGTLISMAQHVPASDALIEAWGNLGSPDGDRAAAPTFTSCGLTSKGWALAEKLLAQWPHLVSQPKEFFRCL